MTAFKVIIFKDFLIGGTGMDTITGASGDDIIRGDGYEDIPRFGAPRHVQMSFIKMVNSKCNRSAQR